MKKKTVKESKFRFRGMAEEIYSFSSTSITTGFRVALRFAMVGISSVVGTDSSSASLLLLLSMVILLTSTIEYISSFSI